MTLVIVIKAKNYIKLLISMLIAVCMIFVFCIIIIGNANQADYVLAKSEIADKNLLIETEESSIKEEINRIINNRNGAFLTEDAEGLMALYDSERTNGKWAHEHSLTKMRYLNQWKKKQDICFSKIESDILITRVKKKTDGYTLHLAVSTEYVYSYNFTLDSENSFRIGTYHTVDLVPSGTEWRIVKEWYTDPFADIIDIDKIDTKKIKDVINMGEKKDLNEISEKRQIALDYIDTYCGVKRPPNFSFHYNDSYTNYNPLGGDCANFASQMIYESGGFKKSKTWNYSNGKGSKAWVNAHAFNNFMIYSGRGTVIDHGTYEQVIKESYQLLPGDYIAYEKKGKVAHISVVSGSDSKGYTLVNSHNTDRFRVPWDLGWSGSGIKFWLVRVNY